MENVKDWLEKKGYYNSGLRTDRNHRIDLYLSDVLDKYRTELLRIHNVVGQSEQYTCDCKVCGKPFGDKLSLYEHYNEEHN
jgi:hypothetical protein